MRAKEDQAVLVWKCNGCGYIKGYSLADEEPEGSELRSGEPCPECEGEYYAVFPCNHNATVPLDGNEIGNELCSDCGVIIEVSIEERLEMIDNQIQKLEKQLDELKSIREELTQQ